MTDERMNSVERDMKQDARLKVDAAIEDVVGELHALLMGDSKFKMAEGDVEFFPGGEELGRLEVDIRGRRYRITVEDIGNSSAGMVREVFGIQEQNRRDRG